MGRDWKSLGVAMRRTNNLDGMMMIITIQVLMQMMKKEKNIKKTF